MSIFIGISGGISSGKTTLTTALSEVTGWMPFYEAVKENTYLGDFYKYMSRYNDIQRILREIPEDMQCYFESQIPAFLQIEFLWKRYDIHQHCLCTDSVSDRLIFEDTIFAKMLYDKGFIREREFTTYMNLFNSMKRTMMYPDAIVYLRVKPEVAFERMKKRNRGCESDVTIEYLSELGRYYEEYITGIKQFVPVLEKDWNRDLADGEEYFAEVLKIQDEIVELISKQSPFFRSVTKI